MPLSQIATLEYGFEDGIIWHRNRLPTITIGADGSPLQARLGNSDLALVLASETSANTPRRWLAAAARRQLQRVRGELIHPTIGHERGGELVRDCLDQVV